MRLDASPLLLSTVQQSSESQHAKTTTIELENKQSEDKGLTERLKVHAHRRV